MLKIDLSHTYSGLQLIVHPELGNCYYDDYTNCLMFYTEHGWIKMYQDIDLSMINGAYDHIEEYD